MGVVGVLKATPRTEVRGFIYQTAEAVETEMLYLAGVAGVAGVTGFAGVVCPVLIPDRTDRGLLLRWIRTVSPIDVNIKRMAAHVVTLVSRLAAPRGPNAVWDPWPPKAPARSALLPCCRRTTPIRIRQTIT
jgi:hypothetical protein